jgi:LysM repeat protein
MFVRIAIVAGLLVLAWSAVARSSDAHGARRVVTVRPNDTLWAIAQRNYGGDIRDAVWRIEHRNNLRGADLRIGQKLVLP